MVGNSGLATCRCAITARTQACLQFREPYYGKFGFKRAYLRDLPRSLKYKYAFGWFFTRLFRYKMIAMKRAVIKSG